MSTATVTLTGAALRAEASRLAIPGRSKMNADQLREAVAATLATLAAAAEDTRTDAEYREVFDDTAEGAEEPELMDANVEAWAALWATRALTERGGTPISQQRPQPVTDTLDGQVDRFLTGNQGRTYAEALDKAHGEALATITPSVFAARWGKRKPSTNGRTHRRTGR